MSVMALSSQAACHSFLTLRLVVRVWARRSTALRLTRASRTQSSSRSVPALRGNRPAATSSASGMLVSRLIPALHWPDKIISERRTVPLRAVVMVDESSTLTPCRPSPNGVAAYRERAAISVHHQEPGPTQQEAGPDATLFFPTQALHQRSY